MDNQIDCYICFEKGDKDKLTQDKGHSIITCVKCKFTSHLRCSGEETKTWKNEKHESDIILFECQKCSVLPNIKEVVTCMLCNKTKGLFTKVNENWVHIICALFCDLYECIDWQRMNFICAVPENQIDTLTQNKKKCSICNDTKGILLNCQKESCDCSIHFYCLIEEKIKKLLEDNESNNFWQIHWKPYITSNSKINKTFLNFPVLNIEEKEKAYSITNPLYDIDLYSNTNKYLLDEKKVKKVKKNAKINLKDYLSLTEGKNWILENRGGKFDILCIEHREQIKYCKCQLPFDKPEFMICCDNCEVWFHGRCVGINEDKPITTWICEFCQQWITKRNYLKEEYSQDLVKILSERDLKQNTIFEHIHYRVIDLIQLSCFYQKKTEALVEAISLYDIIQKHITLSLQIPMKLQWFVFQLQAKILLFKKEEENKGNKKIAIASNDTINESILYFETKCEKGLIDITTNEINSTLLTECKDEYERINSLIVTKVEVSRVITEDILKLKKILLITKWGIEACSFFSSDSKPTLQEIKQHNLKYPSHERNYFKNEYTKLNKFIEETLKWQKNTKELLSHHMNLKKSKAEENNINEDDIEIIIGFDDKKKFMVDKEIPIGEIKKAENYLKKDSEYKKIYFKRQQFIKNFDFKMKLNDISKIISTGKELKVNLNKEIQTMEECIKESLEWEEQLKKLKDNPHTKKQEYEELLYNTKNIVISNNQMYDIANMMFLTELNEYKIMFLKNIIMNLIENEQLKTNELTDDILIEAVNLLVVNSNLSLTTCVQVTNLFFSNFSDVQNFHKKNTLLFDQERHISFEKEINLICQLIQIIKSKYNSILKNESKTNMLNNYIKILENIRIFDDDTRLLKKKIITINNIEKQLNQTSNKISKEGLDDINSQIKSNNLEDLFGSTIKSKIDIINKLKIFIENYTNNTLKDANDIMHQSKYLLSELEKHKIISEDLVIIEKIIKVYNWYKSTLESIELKKSDTTGSKIKFIVESINTDKIEKNDYEIDDMLHLHIDFVKRLLSDIYSIVKDNKLTLIHGPALGLFDKLSILSWYKKAKSIKTIIDNNFNEKLDIDELHELTNIQVNTLNNDKIIKILKEIQSLLLKYNEFSREYVDLESIVSLGAENLNEANEKLSNLLKNNILNQINLKEKMTQIEIFKFIIEKLNLFNGILNKKDNKFSLKEGEEFLSEFENKINIYNKLVDSYKNENSQGIKITSINSSSFSLFNQLLENKKNTQIWINKYNEFKQSKQTNQLKNYDINKLTSLLVESNDLLFDFSIEKQEISNEIKKIELWIEKVKDLVEFKINSNLDYQSFEEERKIFDLYKEEIITLNSELKSIPNINNKNLISSLVVFDWIVNVYNILIDSADELNLKETQSITFKRLDLKTANKLISDANLTKKEIKNSQIYRLLSKNIQKGKNTKDLVEILKKEQRSITEEEFIKLNEACDECLLVLKDEKDYLKHLKSKKEEFQSRYEVLLGSKQQIVEYEKLIYEIKKFPIKLKILISLETTINTALEEQRIIRKITENKNKHILEIEKLEKYVVDYNNSKITHIEGDNLIKTINKSKDLLNHLITSNYISSNEEEISHNDLMNLQDKLDQIEIHDIKKEKHIRIILWINKCFVFVFKNDSNRKIINYRLVKGILIEAEEIGLNLIDSNEYLKFFDRFKSYLNIDENNDYFTSIIIKLKEIVKKSEDYILQIVDCNNMLLLKDIQDQVENEMIDIDDFISEQELKIEYGLVVDKHNHSNLNRKRERIDEEELIRERSNKDIGDKLLKEIGLQDDEYLTNSSNKHRLKRPVNMKIDKDFLYEDSYLDKLKESVQYRNDIEKINIFEENNDNKEKNAIAEKLKKATSSNNNKTDFNSIKIKAITTIEDLLKENKLFTSSKAPENYIKNNVDEIEKMLNENCNNDIEKYKIQLHEVIFMLKEINKLKNVSEQVLKGKLVLSKIIKSNKNLTKLINIDKDITLKKEDIKKSKQGASKKPPIQSNTNANGLFDFIGEKDNVYNALIKSNDTLKLSNQKSSTSNIKDNTKFINIFNENDSISERSENNVRFSPINLEKEKSNTNIQSPISPSSPNMNTEEDNNEEYNPLSLLSNFKYSIKQIQPILYNPNKPLSLFQNNNLKNSEVEVQTGSVLQIWKGIFISQSSTLQMQMISNSSYKIWKTLTSLPEKIIINSKARNKEVIPYIEKYYNNKTKQILSGWFEINDINSTQHYLNLYNELSQSDKSGFVKLKDDNKLYITPYCPENSSTYNSFFSKYSNVDFYNSKLMSNIVNTSNKNNDSKNNILLFFLIVTNKSTFNLIQPEVLISKNQMQLENDDNISILTLENEENNNRNADESQLRDNLYSDYQTKTKQDILKEMIKNNDTKLLEEYIAKFKSMSKEESIQELSYLDDETSMELLTLIQKYEEDKRKIEQAKELMETNQNYQIPIQQQIINPQSPKELL